MDTARHDWILIKKCRLCRLCRPSAGPLRKHARRRGIFPYCVFNQPAERQPHRSRAPDAVARSGAFIVLAAAMSLAAFAVYAAVVNLIPLLHQPGLTTGGAAVALGLGGVGQVLGRLGYGRLTAATDVRTRTAVVLVAAAATIILLGLLPGPAPRTVRDGGSLADLGGSAYHVALSGKVDELLADQRVRESYLGIS